MYKINKDGDSWVAFNEDTFIDLQMSDAGYGDTPLGALTELMVAERMAEIKELEADEDYEPGLDLGLDLDIPDDEKLIFVANDIEEDDGDLLEIAIALESFCPECGDNCEGCEC